jgi:hypothetical protein
VALLGRDPTQALDALIVLALPGDLAADLPLPEDAARFLTPKGRHALDALGPDIVWPASCGARCIESPTGAASPGRTVIGQVAPSGVAGPVF